MSIRSLGSSENIYVLVGILLVTITYSLVSAANRRGQDRKAAERKRRLLGIPDASVLASKDANRTPNIHKSPLAALWSACFPRASTRDCQSAVDATAGATAASASATVTQATETPQRKGKNARATPNLETPTLSTARSGRSRLSGSPAHPAGSPSSSSTSPASRKTSRSVSSTTARAEQASEGNRVHIPTKPKTRSIAIQCPSDEEETVEVSDKAVQVSLDDAAADSGISSLVKSSEEPRSTKRAGQDQPEHPVAAGLSDPVFKDRANDAAANNVQAAQPVDVVHATDLTSRALSNHPETPRANQRQGSQSPSTETVPSASTSRGASTSGRSAAWSTATDDTVSTGQTSPTSSQGLSSQADGDAMEGLSAEARLPTSPVDAQHQRVRSSLRSATARAQAEYAPIHGAPAAELTEDRKRGVSAPNLYLPTPPNSEKRMSSSLQQATDLRAPGDTQPVPISRTLYDSKDYATAPTPPLSPTPAKAYPSVELTGAAMQRQNTVHGQAKPSEEASASEVALADDGFPTLYRPSAPSSNASVSYSAASSRAPSPLPPVAGFPPASLHTQPLMQHSNGVHLTPQHYASLQAQARQQQQQQQQSPSMESYQAHQLMLLRNMQAMQAQLQYVQAGLFPGSSGRVSNPGTPLLSPSPNGTWPPATPGVLGQTSPGLMVSPRTPAEAYGFGHLQPYASMPQYGGAVASTSFNHSLPGMHPSTSYPDGTVIEHSSAASSASSRRRQSSYGELSISTPPSSVINGKRKTSRKLSKSSIGRAASYSMMTPLDGLASPTPASREIAEGAQTPGEESFAYSHGRRPTYNSYKRRDSAPSGFSASTGKKGDRAQREAEEKEQMSENLALLEAMQDDDALDEEGRKVKLKAIAAILERKGKELEIANWKLKCVEVDRLNTETEHQKALNHFYERAERAEARLKLMDAGGKTVPEVNSANTSPQLATSTLIPDGSVSDAGTDGNSLRVDTDEPAVSVKSRRLSDAVPFEVQSPSSPFGAHLGSPNVGPPLRYPPHPFGTKSGKRNVRSRKVSSELVPRLPSASARVLSAKSSNGSFDSRASPAEDDGDDHLERHTGSEDEDDLEIVLHSAGRSPNLPPTNMGQHPPTSLPMLDDGTPSKSSDGGMGLGFSVAPSGSSAPEDSDVATANYVGSLPSFTFSKPPKSPTRAGLE